MLPSLDAALHHHAIALRELARALVGDNAADDLVQETALAALRSAQRPDSPRSWLAQVLRHLAGKHHRAAIRRRRHESRARLGPSQLAPDQLVEHRETLLQLTKALTSLPEPYQSTLLQRYFEDLKPGAIAARAGVPLATVKSRLQRGIALLRERMEADQHSGWRLGLGAAFGLESGKSAAAATVTERGVLLMSLGSKLVLSGAATLVALAAWWWSSEAAMPEPRRVADAPVAVGPDPVGADLGVRTAETNERHEVAPAPNAPEAAVQTSVRGRCVDEYGRPLPRCEVELRGSKTADGGKVDHSRAYGQWLAAHPDAGWRNLLTTTSDDGVFLFELPAPPLDYELRLRRDTLDHLLPIGDLDPKEPKDLGDVVLPASCVVSGRVVDTTGEPDRRPIVTVRRSPTDVASGPVPQLQTRAENSADGRFTARVVAGSYEVLVRHRTVVRGGTLQPASGAAQLDVEVVVERVLPADTIDGIVVDALGQPAPGVRVLAINATNPVEVSADEQGRFTLFRSREKAERVFVTAFNAERESEEQLCAWGTHDLRLVLGEARPRNTLDLQLRVTTEAGEPVTDFTVLGFTATQPWRPVAGHHEDGIARFAEAAADLEFLVVVPDRWDLWTSGFVPMPTPHAATVQLDITLPAAGERDLQVLHHDGRPASGVAVELIDPRFVTPTLGARALTLAKMSRPAMKSLPDAMGDRPLVLLLKRATTDSDGRVRLHGPVATPLALRLPGPGHTPLLVNDVGLGQQEPLVVRLTAGATVAGQLTPLTVADELREFGSATGESARRTRGGEKEHGFRLRRTEGKATTFVPPLGDAGSLPRPDGTFAIEGVPPGTWELILPRWDSDRVSAAELVPLATVELRDGETAHVAVDLPDWLLARIDGRVLANGRPCAQQKLYAMVGDRAHRIGRAISTDAEGRFTVRVRHGTLGLCIHQTTPRWNLLMNDYIWARERVVLLPGERITQDFHLDTGKLVLRVLDAAGNPVPDVGLYLRGGGDSWHTTTASGVDGRLAVEVEAGSFTALVMPRRLAAADRKLFASHWQPDAPDPHPLAADLLTAGAVTAKAGETVEAELRLPIEWGR